MQNSLSEIKEWIDQGISQGATHLIVVYDESAHSSYAVYVTPHEYVRSKEAEYRKREYRQVIVTFSLRGNIEAQLTAYLNSDND